MSSAGSFGVLKARFDPHINDESAPRTDALDASGQQRPLAAEIIGPVQVVPHLVEGLPEPASTAASDDGLHTSRGILVGVLLGSACWGVAGGLLYMILG